MSRALGYRLYMALTGHHPYSPELPREKHNKAVMARYTEAQLPNGQVLPVWIVLGSSGDGRQDELEGSQPGAAVLQRMQPVSSVRW